MSIFNKFYNLIQKNMLNSKPIGGEVTKEMAQKTENGAIQEKASSTFNSLIKGNNPGAAQKMVDKGYLPTEENVRLFFTQFVNFDAEYRAQSAATFVQILIKSILEQRQGDSEIFTDNFFKKKFSSYLIAHALIKLTHLEVQVSNFNNLELNEKIKFVADYSKAMEEVKQYDFRFNLTYFIERKEICQKIIEGGVDNLMEDFTAKQPSILIAKKVEQLIGNKLSPQFQEIIEQIDDKIDKFKKSKIELGVEEQIVINKIIQQDIPAMVSSVALLPLEMQMSYKNDEGVGVRESLLNLLVSYRVSIDSILNKASQDHMVAVDKSLKVSQQYIEKINPTDLQSKIPAIRGVKTISIGAKMS